MARVVLGGVEIVVPKLVFESCLEGARRSFPAEFLALFSGGAREGGVTVEKLYLPPLSESDATSAWFDSLHLPLTARVVGTFHSHPAGPALPSGADLRLFSRYPGVHVIAARPYGARSCAAFDSRGKPAGLIVK